MKNQSGNVFRTEAEVWETETTIQSRFTASPLQALSDRTKHLNAASLIVLPWFRPTNIHFMFSSRIFFIFSFLMLNQITSFHWGATVCYGIIACRFLYHLFCVFTTVKKETNLWFLYEFFFFSNLFPASMTEWWIKVVELYRKLTLHLWCIFCAVYSV